jgi:hypothetical protein
VDDVHELKKRFLEACAKNEFNNAIDALSLIQAKLPFPLLFPEVARHVPEQDVDEYLDLLHPLMQLYFQHEKLNDTLQCCAAIVAMLGYKPVTNWSDPHWRADCNAQHMRLKCYEKLEMKELVEAACKVAIYDGEQIVEKHDDDWRLLLTLFRSNSPKCGRL